MTTDESVRAIGIKELPTKSLQANPHNPRMLFDRADMDVLRASIKRVGILVPLTVYNEEKTGVYRILDGQRRWMCALDIGLESIPVNEVAEPTLVQNIVTMFQIHKLRKDWELMPTALKLELLMRELQEKNDKKIAALTGLDEAVVVRCKKLLSYHKKYQDMMLDPDPNNRAKADFFIELYVIVTDRNVKKFRWFRRDRFTDDMLRKSKAGALHSVTEFRVVKQHINNAAKAKKLSVVSTLLKEFADDPQLTVSHLEIADAGVAATVRSLTRAVDSLSSQLSQIDENDLYGQDDLWNRLESLSDLIRSTLRRIGRRVSD